MNTFIALKQKVIKKPLPLVIGLGGSERAFVDEALALIRQEVLSPESAAFNHTRLMVSESDFSTLKAELYTMPFLAQHRLIEINGAEKLDDLSTKMLIEYLAKPSPSSVAVIIFGKIDKRNKLINALSNGDFLYVFDGVSEQEIIDIICQETKALGLVIGRDVAQIIALMLDNDVLAIRSALQKLSLLGQGHEISQEDIENHLCTAAEQDVFLLAKNICEGRVAESLYYLGLLRNNHENAIKFLGVLVWQFRVVLHMRHCFERGLSDQETMKQVSVYGARFRELAVIARKKTIAFHMQRLTKLLECDAALKSLNLKEPFNLIEKVVYQSAVGL